MIITLSLVNGFQETVAAKVLSFWGDARVQPLDPMRAMAPEGEGFARTDTLDRLISGSPGVTGYFAYAVKSVVLKSKTQFEGIMLKGVDHKFDTARFGRFVKVGRTLGFADTAYSRDIIISEPVAQRLAVQTGDTLTCFFVRGENDIRSRAVVVSGIYKTGISEYDNQLGLCDLRFLQRLNQWPPQQIGGFELSLASDAAPDLIAAALDDKLPMQLSCLTIQQVFPNIFDWLGIQNQTKQIVVITMLVVAIINLITCLLILVMERTRMVGLLKALGMPRARIGHIFWLYAGWIALVGVGLGLLLGVGLCLLQQYTGWVKMDEATYYIDTVPVAMRLYEVAGVCLGSMAVIMLAVRLPLFYIQLVSPIKAIRFQ